jgi:hypothetical protein
MKYNVVEFIRNTADAYTAKVTATYDNLESAAVKYHQDLAAFHNASDVLLATVKIEDEYGHEVIGFFEVVDHSEPETTEA